MEANTLGAIVLHGRLFDDIRDETLAVNDLEVHQMDMDRNRTGRPGTRVTPVSSPYPQTVVGSGFVLPFLSTFTSPVICVVCAVVIVRLFLLGTYLKPADRALGAWLTKSGCAAGSDYPAAAGAACAVWLRNSDNGMANVIPAAMADLVLSVRKSRRFMATSCRHFLREIHSY